MESIPTGVSEGVATLGNYVKSLGLLFNKEGAKQIGGFGTIGGLFFTLLGLEAILEYDSSIIHYFSIYEYSTNTSP